MQREVVFPRSDEAEAGQPADFRRKRASLNAEEVRKLLAVEWDVKFGCAFLQCDRAQICHQSILRGAMRQNLDLSVQLKCRYGESAHDVPDKAGMERAGVLAWQEDAVGLDDKNVAAIVCFNIDAHSIRPGQRLCCGNDFPRAYPLDDGATSIEVVCRDGKRAREQDANPVGAFAGPHQRIPLCKAASPRAKAGKQGGQALDSDSVEDRAFFRLHRKICAFPFHARYFTIFLERAQCWRDNIFHSREMIYCASSTGEQEVNGHE